jgi:hypothetical protein
MMSFCEDQGTFIAYSWMLRVDDNKIGTQDTYRQSILASVGTRNGDKLKKIIRCGSIMSNLSEYAG